MLRFASFPLNFLPNNPNVQNIQLYSTFPSRTRTNLTEAETFTIKFVENAFQPYWLRFSLT